MQNTDITRGCLIALIVVGVVVSTINNIQRFRPAIRGGNAFLPKSEKELSV